MAVSEAMRSYWLIGLLMALSLGIGLPLWVRRSESGKEWWDRTQLRLPVIGPIMQKIVLSRFANTLAMMYRSGVTVLDALRAGEMIAGNRVIARGIRRASQQIADGRGLSESFQSMSLFPPLVIRMLRVGETTGALDEALENVTFFYNREVLESIENGLRVLEPMLTAILGLLLGGILVSVLLPVYDLIGNLPLWVRQSEAGREWWDRTQLRLPIIGPVVQKIALSRFTSTLAMMYRSGVTVLDALRAGEMVAGNRVIASGIRRAAQQIADGRGLSESFQSVALFPPLVLRMLRVGETTGALDEALDNVTYFYNREVLDSIENGLRVLEPLLTAILGLLLGGILVSVLLPIYDLIGNLPL
jgi:type II secretory pathway component PulF